VRLINYLSILILILSCAKKPSELTAEALDVALSHLSKNECDEALKILLKVENEDDNPVYLQVLASAYACKADFNEVIFVEDDLATLLTTSTQTIMTSLTKMTMSFQSAVDSDNYQSILKGMNILLNATSGVPNQTSRNQKFGPRRGAYIGSQALFLGLVNLGKFLNYFGNVNVAGSKGLGSGTNSCFINYTDTIAENLILIGGIGGICNSVTDGHPDLDLTTDAGRRRACEGVVLIANVIDIIDNLEFSGSDDLKILEEFSAQVNLFLDIAENAGLGSLVNLRSQSDCETLMNTPSNLNDLEHYYALIFEKGLQ
jgi:hypothetical protein